MADLTDTTTLQNDKINIMILLHLAKFKTAIMGDFEELLQDLLNRELIKYVIKGQLTNKILTQGGSGKGTRYKKVVR